MAGKVQDIERRLASCEVQGEISAATLQGLLDEVNAIRKELPSFCDALGTTPLDVQEIAFMVTRVQEATEPRPLRPTLRDELHGRPTSSHEVSWQ